MLIFTKYYTSTTSVIRDLGAQFLQSRGGTGSSRTRDGIQSQADRRPHHRPPRGGRRQDRGRHRPAGHRQEQAAARHGPGRRPGQAEEGRHAARRCRSRPATRVLFTTWAGDEFKDRKARPKAKSSSCTKSDVLCGDRVRPRRPRHERLRATSTEHQTTTIPEARMAAKQIAFDQEAREAMRRGRRQARPRRQGDARAQGPQRHPPEVLRLARPSPRTASPSPRKSSSKTSTRTWAPAMVKEVARKTSDVAGDGTTTATVLAEAIFNEGLQGRRRRRQPDAHEARHREGRRGHRRQAQEDDRSRSRARRTWRTSPPSPPTTTTRSARSSPRRWTRSARTASSPSRKARRSTTDHEFVEGMQFDRGYLSPYFVTDPQKMECELEDPYILIYEKKISQQQGPRPGAGEGRSSRASRS